MLYLVFKELIKDYIYGEVKMKWSMELTVVIGSTETRDGESIVY